MLSSASNVAAWAKKGRDVERLLKTGAAPYQSQVSPSGSLRSRVNGSAQVMSRSIVSNVSIEAGSRLISGVGALSQGAERAYHTTSVVMKKKVVNTKAIATQGRRTKEKSEDEVSVKLVMKAGPGASKKVEKKKTKLELMEAQEQRAALAGESPDGLLVHQKKQLLRKTVQTGGQMPLLLDVVKKLKEAYPATFALIRYQWLRMPISMRANLVTQSPDFKSIQNDPDMKPFTEWLERLDGRGGPLGENYFRMLARRQMVSEKLKLTELWKEVDAGLAEVRAEGELADLHFAPDDPISTEELAEYDAEERKEIEAILNDDILNDPEMQVVLSYMAFPRASIDPKGTLSRALEPSSLSDVDILAIAQARPIINIVTIGLKNQILRDMPEVLREDLQALFELSRQAPPSSQPEALEVWKTRQAAAKARLSEADQNGLTGSLNYTEAIKLFKNDYQVDHVPDPVALRLLIDSAEQSVDRFFPELRTLNKHYGPDVASEIISDRAVAVEHEEDGYNIFEDDKNAMVPSFGAVSDVTGPESNEAFADMEDEDLEEIYHSLLDDIEGADDEEAEISLMPVYAESVKKELTTPLVTSKEPLTPEQAKFVTDRYTADLEAWMEMRPIDDQFASVEDRAVVEAKTNEERLSLVKRVLNVQDASVRQTARAVFFEYVDEVLEKTGFKDPADALDHDILAMTEKMRQAIAADTKMPAEEAQKLKEMVGLLEDLKDDDPEDSLPVGNPETQFNEIVTTLQMAKDMILERNSELNSLESRMDGIFVRAREMTKRLLGQGTPESPRHSAIVELEKAFVSVYGSPTPNHIDQITADDAIAQWSTQMKEDIVMLEARTQIQRERDTISELRHAQMQSVTSVSRPPSPYERDFGIYNFTSADFTATKPVEDRIYVSSSLETDEIFTKANVGKYLSLTANDLKRHLPEGFSLPLTKQEFAMTKTHDILIRQATLDAIANLKAQLNNSFLAPHHLNTSSTKAPQSSTKTTKQKNLSSKADSSDVARPMLLHGYRGCGKSAVMSQVVYWARRNDWLVVNVPDGTDSLSSGVYISKNATDGTWDQPKLFVRFFGHLLSAHSDKLKQIPLKAPNVKIGKQQCKTLFDVVEYGSVLEASAAQCFNIFRSEIRKVVEFPVLLAFDSYNSLYVPSRDFSDPESTSYHKKALDPYNMTFGRLFHDAHLNPRLAYGTFIGGLTESTPIRPFLERTPQTTRGIPITQPKYLEVPPYTMPEFTTVMEHYKHKNWVRTHMNSGSASELYIYQITSGFGNAIWNFTARL